MGNVHACSACGHVHEAEELHWDEKEPVPDVLTGRALGRLVPEIRSLSTADRERVGRLVRIGFGIKAKSTGIPLKAKIWLFILFMTVIVDMGLFKISAHPVLAIFWREHGRHLEASQIYERALEGNQSMSTSL